MHRNEKNPNNIRNNPEIIRNDPEIMRNNLANHPRSKVANKGAANIEIMHMVKGQSKTNEHTLSPTTA